MHHSTYMPGFPNYVPYYKSQHTENVATNNIYPDVNSQGFIEMKISGRDYTDDINKLDTIRADQYYNKIPKDIVKGTLKFDKRYNVRVEGKLDKQTEVKYNIQKEPDFPGNYNVEIKKDSTKLTFGDFNTNYKSGNYINIEKYLNGVELSIIENKWNGTATIGKEKSEPQKFETYGN